MNSRHQRSREFSQTRLSYSRQAPSVDVASRTPTHLTPSRRQPPQKDDKLCVKCFNHQLSIDKNKKQQEWNREGTPQNQTLPLSRHNPNLQAKNKVKQINEYNIRAKESNDRRRREQKQQQLKEQQAIFKQNQQNNKILQERKTLDEQRRNQLRQDLEKQITFAKQRRRQEEDQNRKQIPRSLIEFSPNQIDRHSYENAYRQDLLKQINQKKQQKLKEEQSLKQNPDNQLHFIVKADEKIKQAYLYERNKKQSIRNQLKRKAEIENQKKEMQAKLREQENLNRGRQELEAKMVTEQKQQQRKDKIEKYLQDLRKQMQENTAKRTQQFKFQAKQGENTLLIPKKDPGVQPCSCCSKLVPKPQLAPYIKQISK